MDAQINESIDDPKVIEINGGIVVYGLAGEKKDKTFLVQKLDYDLKVTAEYKRQVGEFGQMPSVAQQGNILTFAIQKSFFDYSSMGIRLDLNLKEVSFELRTKEEIKSGWKQKFNIDSCHGSGRYTEHCNNLRFSVWDSNDKELKESKKEGRLSHYDGKAAFLCFERIDPNYTSGYKLKWIHEFLQGEVYALDYVQCDSVYTVIRVGTREAKISHTSLSSTEPYIYFPDRLVCMETKTGRCIFDRELKWGSNEIFFSKSYFDNQLNQFIVLGNNLLNEGKIKVDRLVYSGYAALKLDMKGEILNYQLHKFPEYNAEETYRFNFKRSMMQFDTIVRIGVSEFFVVATSKASYGLGDSYSYLPMGITSFGINHALELISSCFVLFEDYNEPNSVGMEGRGKLLYFEDVHITSDSERVILYQNAKVAFGGTVVIDKKYNAILLSAKNQLLGHKSDPDLAKLPPGAECFLKDKNSLILYTPKSGKIPSQLRNVMLK